MQQQQQMQRSMPGQNDLFAPIPASVVPDISPIETAERIVQMAKDSVPDPRISSVVRWMVRNIADENYDMFASVMSEIQVVYNWVHKHIRYTKDPHGVELVYSPAYVVSMIQQHGKWAEDCDSYAALLMTLFLALGRRVRLTIAGFSPDPNRYTHVFVEVLLPRYQNTPSRWVIVDPSVGKKVKKMASSITTAKSFYP